MIKLDEIKYIKEIKFYEARLKGIDRQLSIAIYEWDIEELKREKRYVIEKIDEYKRLKDQLVQEIISKATKEAV